MSPFARSQLGLRVDTEHHIAYIGHWQQKIKDDRRFIGKCAAEAQKGVTLLLSFRPSNDNHVEPVTLDSVVSAAATSSVAQPAI